MDKQTALQELYNQYRNIDLLQLADFEGRNFVPGEGNVNAQLMLIGEAPGRFEDQAQRPFIGRAGQLLTKALESLRISREQVFISNVVKYRPPKNRTPYAHEVAAFKELILKEIEIINPLVICLLGTTATQTLLGQDKQISQVRGKLFALATRTAIPVYHPAYLLRNPSAMPHLISDLKEVLPLIDREK
ncbi:MAG: uracil-DNA glycosylase [Candidatus Babeliales bacterium]